MCRCLSGPFYTPALRYPGLDNAADNAAIPFHESQSVRETAFKENADAVVPSQIGRSHKGHVFANSKMGEMTELRQDEKPFGDRTLNFIQLFAKVLHKNFLQVPGKLYRFFTDEFEALIQLFQSVFRDERPSFQGFFDFRVFGDLADFFVEFGGPLGVLTYIAEERDKYFFRISYWHDFLLR